MSHASDNKVAGWLALVLSPQADIDKAVALAVQAKADGLDVLLVGCSVKQVFAAPALLQALRSGVFSRVLLSTAEHYLATDALAAVKSLPDAALWLTVLQADTDFTAVAGCWQSAVLSERLTAIADTQVVVAPVSVFRSCRLPKFCLAQMLVPALLGKAITPSLVDVTLAEQALFVTATGVGRFGGLDNFLSLPFYQGELWQGDIADCWQLTEPDTDAVDSTDTAGIDLAAKRLPLSLACSDDSVMLFDLLPAQCTSGQLWHQINVPRMVLSIRRMPAFASAQFAAGPVAFAMSLYNKAIYLHQAVYSVAMQSYKQVALHIIDDGSTDASVARLQQFISLAPSTLPIKFEHGSRGFGTYAIRNRIVDNSQGQAGHYLVQDADDISSAGRAQFQLGYLQHYAEAEACISDMVRIDGDGQVLTLEGLAERYGSATLCASVGLHQQLGYYENITKNADSEFIERIKALKGPAAVLRCCYPVLYQRYDGNNLTADIYQQTAHHLMADHRVRSRHKQLFSAQHQQLSLDSAQRLYAKDAPPSADYNLLLKGFVPAAFSHPKPCLSTLALGLLFAGASAPQVTLLTTTEGLTINADLPVGEQQQLLAPETLAASNLRQYAHGQNGKNDQRSLIANDVQIENKPIRLPIFFAANGQGNALLMLVYRDKTGVQLGYELFAPATPLQMQLPENCVSVSLGLQLTGQVALTVKELCFAE